jgi:hypothetical protein
MGGSMGPPRWIIPHIEPRRQGLSMAGSLVDTGNFTLHNIHPSFVRRKKVGENMEIDSLAEGDFSDIS